MIFLKRKALYVVNKLLKFYFTLSILTISNEKTQNYKVVDLMEGNNFYIKIFIRGRMRPLFLLPPSSYLSCCMQSYLTKMSSFRWRACRQTKPSPSRRAACADLWRDWEGPDSFQFLERHMSHRDTPAGAKLLRYLQFTFAWHIF
jgi:hypothetical protein